MPKSLLFKLLWRSFYGSIALICIGIGLNTYLNGSIWEGMTISKSALTVEYCEFNQVDKLFHQTMNTYSNVSYFFLGVLILQIGWEDYKNRKLKTLNQLEKFPLLSVLMGFCFIYLSFGSAFFHASLTWVAQRVDMNGTYSVTITLVGIAIYHILHKIKWDDSIKNIWIIALSFLIIAFLKIALLVSSSILLPALILLLLLFIGINYVQFRRERSLILGILSFILIIIAVKIRTLDVQKIGCDPYSFYQGHAVWHLLTGLSSFCSYAFFRFTKQ